MADAIRAAMRWNVDALKEPRGFIRIIEFVIAIFAFATTTSSSSSSSFKINCPDEKGPFSYAWGYPFRLENTAVKYQNCNGTEQAFNLYGNYAAPSQFFVFVGVMAFLYCIGIVIFYVGFDDLYKRNEKIPIIDFFSSAAFVLLWLISSSAWASGVADVKLYTDLDEIKIHMNGTCNNNECVVVDGGNYAGLNVSIIFGFLCMGVWAGNLWFLYKETKWYSPPAEDTSAVQSEPQQRI